MVDQARGVGGTMTDAFRMLARYNRTANERLYASCSELSDDDYRRERRVSFGSIFGLLNHMLLGDRIWMKRFTGEGAKTPPLNTVLYEGFADLRRAREEEDAKIETFFEAVEDDFLERLFAYTNNQGKPYRERAAVAALHFFNHQTHHRGQVHAMLSETGAQAPSLDLHRVLNP